MQDRPRFRPNPSLDDPSIEEIIRRANRVSSTPSPSRQPHEWQTSQPHTQRVVPPHRVQSPRQRTDSGYAVEWALVFGLIAGSLASVLCPIVVAYPSGTLFISLMVDSFGKIISLTIVCMIAVAASFITSKISGFIRTGTMTGAVLGITFGALTIITHFYPRGLADEVLTIAFFSMIIGMVLGFIGGLLGMIGYDPFRWVPSRRRVNGWSIVFVIVILGVILYSSATGLVQTIHTAVARDIYPFSYPSQLLTTPSATLTGNIYKGNIHNLLDDKRSTMSLSFESKTGGHCAGDFHVNPPLYGSGHFTGTISGTAIQFTVVVTNDKSSRLSFIGTINSDRSLSGKYTVTGSNRHGEWSVKPS